MDLRALTRPVQEQLVASAAIGDETTRRTAELLSVSLEPALRLALQEAVGQVAAEVSAELAPGRVDLALRGTDLSVHVVAPDPSADGGAAAPSAPATPFVPGTPVTPVVPVGAEPPAPPLPPEASEDAEEVGGGAARVTFRPPQALKARLEQAAEREQLSLNTYLVRALTAHLDAQEQQAQPVPPASTAPRSTGRTSGWFV